MIEPSIWNQINVLSQKNPKKYLMKNVDIKEVSKEEETITNKNENIKNKNEHSPIARKTVRFKYKKRGRKHKNTKENYNNLDITHDKFSDDNIKRKVKTHYHYFIIAFINMKCKNLLWKMNKFGKISSKITQNITAEYNRKLFEQKIQDIIIQSSDKYLNKDRNKNILQTILRKIDKNDEVYKFLNMNYKDMFLEYYLKSNKKTFEGEKEDESYEAHLEKLKNLYGNNYIDSYKRNAESLITFFYTCKNRIRKKKSKPQNNSDYLNLEDTKKTVNNIYLEKDKSPSLKNFEKRKRSIGTQTDMIISESENESI